jgi:hypothetical protein
MRKTIITLAVLVTTNAVAQDCLLTEKTVSKDLGVVQEIRNVQTQLGEWKNGFQSCTATLEGSVNGRWGTGKGVYTWDGNSSPKGACSAAVELAKKDLLEVQKDSTISSVSTVICKERPQQDMPTLNTKIGQIIGNVNTLRKHPSFPNTFAYNGQSCRWFIETGWNGKDINQLNGIVCNMSQQKWIVVDKF